MSFPIPVTEDRTVQGRWVEFPRGVVANKLGTSSVVAIFNRERVWVCNLTSDRDRIDLVHEMYEQSRVLFHNREVEVWIVYAEQNRWQGQRIVQFFEQRVPATCIFKQVYRGPSFLEDGAQVRVKKLVDGTVVAAVGRQDGVGSHVLLRDRTIAVSTEIGIQFV
jgi:hypothetical protein